MCKKSILSGHAQKGVDFIDDNGIDFVEYQTAWRAGSPIGLHTLANNVRIHIGKVRLRRDKTANGVRSACHVSERSSKHIQHDFENRHLDNFFDFHRAVCQVLSAGLAWACLGMLGLPSIAWSMSFPGVPTTTTGCLSRVTRIIYPPPSFHIFPGFFSQIFQAQAAVPYQTRTNKEM